MSPIEEAISLKNPGSSWNLGCKHGKRPSGVVSCSVWLSVSIRTRFSNYLLQSDESLVLLYMLYVRNLMFYVRVICHW